MSVFRVPLPRNEPVRDYAPGSADRAALDQALADLKAKKLDIPMVIGGQEVRTGKKIEIRCPHNLKKLLGEYHQGSETEVKQAVDSAIEAQATWAHMPWEHRAAIFLRAADLLSGPYRHLMNAACMLAHSKTIFQAEIDAVCELVDFWRYNVYYMQQIYEVQPESGPTTWNRLDHRPLEGFVFAVTPFNFVSINGNLPTAPAMLGNVSVWKPASTAAYTSHLIMEILLQAGLPAGVINMIFARGASIGDTVLRNKHLAGIHFTGSTAVFQQMWQTVGANIANYRCYPRIVGETGGKDFIVAHHSTDVEALATAIIRGAFEYQGQKCSAASRCYLPQSIWSRLKELLVEQVGELTMGDPEDSGNFVNAIIDESAYQSICEYIDYARDAKDAEFLTGSKYDMSVGYFIERRMM